MRSTCINWRSVSSPSISGISTSRMMKSGRSPCADARRALPCRWRWLPRRTRPPRAASEDISECSVHHRRSGSFLCVAIGHPYGAILPLILFHIGRQQEGKRASAAQFAIDPNFSAMSLDQSFRDCQSQAHARRRRIDAYKFLEDFLMELGRNPVTRVRD